MRSVLLAAVLSMVACGPPAPTASPRGTPSAVVPRNAKGKPDAAAWQVDGALTREELPAAMPELPLTPRTFPATPKGVPAAPASCAAYVGRKPAAGVTCEGRDDTLESLEQALADTNASARDAALAALESCSELPVGMARALRAELAPSGCADGLVAPALKQAPEGIGGAVYDALFGLGLAGALSRTATDPPRFTGKTDKATIKAFIASDMQPWIVQQAQAIQDLAALGTTLRYYGKAVVAVEAGMADMRFIDAVRALPIPDEFAGDEELREQYLLGLEQALADRTLRGRNAALVGLGSLAFVGVLRDPRVEAARGILARMYGGRPINALDQLLLPPLAPSAPKNASQRLAARLQSFYAGLVFPPDAALDPALLRALIEKGLPLPQRIALAKAELAPDAALLHARARLELGQNYWRRVDFDECARLLTAEPVDKLSADAKLLLAVALALRNGHENAADMMEKAPLAELGIGRVAALDTLSGQTGPLAGMAEFDAALIRQLAAPSDAPASYWKDLASRYAQAHARLTDVRHKQAADERRRDAEETAEAIAASPDAK
jgi:hypothetical protein